jgi:MYXO-CTERM domain-containing protein
VPEVERGGYARARERAEATRAGLEPLAPGERPLGLKLAVALAVFIALANLVAVAVSAGDQPPARGLAFAALMLAAAAGLWARRYLALIAFEGLLALSILYAALSLAFASNLLAALLALTVIVLCVPVFWLLIRVMARLQVPRE